MEATEIPKALEPRQQRYGRVPRLVIEQILTNCLQCSGQCKSTGQDSDAKTNETVI